MKVELVSTDEQVYRACREVLVALQEVQWNLSVVNHPTTDAADLYLWDYESEPSLAGAERIPDHKKVYVVGRKNLAALQEQLRGKPARVLLRSVSPVVFKALLREIIAATRRTALAGSETRVGELQRDRDEMLQCLLECNLRIQEYDQARSVALSHGVHDLRAPLMSILGYSKLLLNGQLGHLNAEQAKVIQRVQQSAQRSYRLANSVLQASAGDGAEFRPRLQPADLGEIAAQAVSELAPLTEARNVQIQTEILPSSKPLRFDPGLILQVLVNLLHNACRFTPKGGRVSVRGLPVFWDRRASNVGETARREERRAMRNDRPNAYRVEVRDTGPGVQEADLERIFDDFASLDGQQDGEKNAHFGLGLGACRHIVDLHHGDIFAQAGQGARFVFVLPFASDGKQGIQGVRRTVDGTTFAVPVE